MHSEMETTQKLVEKALEEGRKIANELQSTKTISEIDQLSDKVEKYCNFVDENFGNIDDFAEKGKEDPRFAALDEICKAHNGLWCLEAENYLLSHWESVD